VVLKTYFSNHCVENFGSDEKVDLGVFPIFVQKVRKLGGGKPNYMSFR
jgi:hypothetical protein